MYNDISLAKVIYVKKKKKKNGSDMIPNGKNEEWKYVIAMLPIIGKTKRSELDENEKGLNGYWKRK